jgi:hypothetical protein
MDAIGWKFFAIYCGWLVFEFLIQFFFYPETQGRTLEELAFSTSLLLAKPRLYILVWPCC